MDRETLWILKKLAAKEISAQSADKIIRGLELLRNTEEGIVTIITGDEQEAFDSEKLSPTENLEESNAVEVEASQEEIQKTELQDEPDETASHPVFAQEIGHAVESMEPTEVSAAMEEGSQQITSTMVAESEEIEKQVSEDELQQEDADEQLLLDENGVCVIEDISDTVELKLIEAKNVIIQGWDQPQIKIEGEPNSAVAVKSEQELTFAVDEDLFLYIPPVINELNVVGGSGSIDIEKYLKNINISSEAGDISIVEARGDINASSVEGNITLENYRGKASLSQKNDDAVEQDTFKADIDKITTDVNIETNSGRITLKDIGSDTSVKSISGYISLKDVVGNMKLENETGDISVEDFSGVIRAKSLDAGMYFKNSGDAVIRIESGNGNIDIKDCYADVYVDSDAGDVNMSGGDLSFDAMGQIDLKIKKGNAYLNRRTFEGISIVIEEGDIELKMEKVNADGSVLLNTNSGNIIVGVVPDIECEFIAHISREKLNMELPIEIINKEKDLLHGMLNGGGSRFEIIALDGEVKFQAMELSHT